MRECCRQFGESGPTELQTKFDRVQPALLLVGQTHLMTLIIREQRNVDGARPVTLSKLRGCPHIHDCPRCRAEALETGHDAVAHA